MRKFFFGVIFSLILLPAVAWAIGAGFVPSSGIWFSDTTATPGALLRVYTVVINNQYYALDGTIGFYDNDSLIDTVQFKALEKESATQLKVLWQPSVGEHVVQARFLNATAINANGKKISLALDELVGVGGTLSTPQQATLAEGDSPANTAPQTTSTQAPIATTSSAPAFAPSARVAVVKENNVLVLSPAAVPNQPGVASAGTSAGFLASINAAVSGASDLFASNRAAFEKAEGAIVAVSNTAGAIGGAYAAAASATAKGQEYYAKTKAVVGSVQNFIEKIDPALVPIKSFWLKITNGNEPKRIIIILLIIVAILILWKFRNARAREHYDR